MSLLPFLGVSATGLVITILLLRRPRAGSIVGLGFVALALVTLLVAGGDQPFTVEGVVFMVTPYGRVLAGIALGIGLLVLVVGLVDGWDAAAAPALLAAATGVALAASCSDAGVALIIAAAASIGTAAICLGGTASASRVGALARESRGALTGLLAGLFAITLLGNGAPGSGAGGLPVEAPVAGLALIAAALAMAHRFGAVPLHARVSRLVDAADPPGLPALVAVLPAAWGVVLLGWSIPAAGTYGADVGIERAAILLVGLAALVLGTAAAVLQDHVEHVVAYAIVQESGLGLLALAALDPSAAEPARTWLVIFIAGRSALIGWTIAFRRVFGTGRLREVGGWIRRAPGLAIALVVIGIAGIGWPGLAAWEARISVIQASTGGPVLLLAYAGSLGTAIAVARILAVGFGQPSLLVAAAERELPRLPARGAAFGARPERSYAPSAARAAGGTTGATPGGLPADVEGAADGEVPGPRDAADDWAMNVPVAAVGGERNARAGAAALFALNRTPVRAIAVLVLAGAALAVAAGGFGLRSAAAGPVPVGPSPSPTAPASEAPISLVSAPVE